MIMPKRGGLMNAKKGFTLVEMVIMLGVIAFIMLGAYNAFLMYFKGNVLMNSRAIKSLLATQRVEEWKSVRGENFAPGVAFPIYTPYVTSAGVISIACTTVSIPAITQLEIDCTANSVMTQASGYSCSLTQGTFGNPGYGAATNCWFHPATRAVTDTTPGDITFIINCPDAITSTLFIKMIDYNSMQRQQRILINNLVKASYVASNLAPTGGATATIQLNSIDTGTGVLTVEIEQTGAVNPDIGVLDGFSTSSANWTATGSGITKSNITTLITPVGFLDSDGMCMTVTAPTTTTATAATLRKALNISSCSPVAGTDQLVVWIAMQDSAKVAWFQTTGGSSNTCSSAVTTGWQKLSRTITAGEITTSTAITIRTTSTKFLLNDFYVLDLNPPNPNAVLDHITMKSLIGFTDPDSTAGAPVPPPGSHYPYIITSTVTPSDATAGMAEGWVVSVSVSKQNDKYQPVTVINTINR